MNRLIILRGPMGSGKSSVSTSLMELLGKDCACILDLDMTHPYADKFNQNLKECLIYKTVIGMMFYGNSHTTNPARWLSEFSATIIRQCLELYSVMIMLQACTCAEISVFHHQQGYTVTLRSVMRKAYRSGRRFSCATRL